METNSNIVVDAGTWAIEVPQSEISAIATLRLRAGVLACRVGDQLWLRGSTLDEQLDRALRRLAPEGRYRWETGGAIVPDGRLLPVGRLPEGPWIPLSELVATAHAPAALAAEIPHRVNLKIARSEVERPATMLRTTLAAWVTYVERAPLIRLKPLHFAASENEVLIRGTPLPPLPGAHYYERAGIALPCGHDWSPPIDAETLRDVLKLDANEGALFGEDGQWQRLPATHFTRATRSAARLTLRENAR